MARTLIIALWLLGSLAATGDAAPSGLLPGPGQGPDGDWAFLSRYRSANAVLGPDSLRVVFLGDSITEAWARDPLLSGNRHFIGRGIGGQTTQQMLVRFQADVIDLRPALVHIMAGTNDVAENSGPETDGEIEEAIESMVQLALANHIKVLLASIPPAADFPWHHGLNPAVKIPRLNAWLKSYAAHAGIGYVDYWPVLATPSGSMRAELSLDGVHPSAQGYAAMRPITDKAIQSMLIVGSAL
jgi:lysophospholipase L1-like esterase